MKRLKIVLAACFLALLPSAARAQQPPRANQTNDPAQTIQQWMKDNVDDDALQLLGGIDQDQVQDFFDKLAQSFASTNIYDLGALKPLALQVLPVLNEFEETAPYGAWLKARLDEMDAANEMQREMRPPGQQPGVITNSAAPSAKFQRAFWVRKMAKGPWPPLARTYVPKLKEVFASEKVPPQLVWVASVESSFDPKARSPAGAAGMFQLMPATARTEHLSLWPFDERYQPEKSARAAAQYLRGLHTHYGDWPLALAAYNVGETRVDRLLKDHQVHSFDAVARWLPAETQMYVPKIEATIRQREGVALADL